MNLVGTFNDWDPKKRILRQDTQGVWKTSMLLEPGAYEYRFLVDGEWQNDSDSDLKPNEFGSENCIRTIE